MLFTMEQTIADLLIATGSAHGDYEATALGGVYDADWATWYAAYLLDHDLGSLLGAPDPIDAGSLAQFLFSYDEAYRHEQPADPWPLDYARRLLMDFAPMPVR